MRISEAHEYVTRSERRTLIVKNLIQPMTAMQLIRRTELSHDACRRIVGDLAKRGIVHCLNDYARRSRLYQLTNLGKSCRRRLFGRDAVPNFDDQLGVDWELYGWVCYRHRSTVVKTLTEPMQPATIKRKARSRDPTLRMSANNVRDIIRLFLQKGIVQPVRIRKKAHLRYELTEVGKMLQHLLIQAESLV